MFSVAQMDIMRPLVAQMRDKGYLYYVAWGNVLSSTTNDYDIYMIFAEDPITANTMYTYAIPDGSIKYSIRSGNAYSNQTAARITTSVIGATTLTINDYQHCSTNAEFGTAVIQPDLFFTEVQGYETQGGTLFMLIVFLFVFAFVHLFRR